MKTTAGARKYFREQQKELSARKRANGLKRCLIWVRSEHAPRLRAYAAKLNEVAS